MCWQILTSTGDFLVVLIILAASVPRLNLLGTLVF